MPVGTISEVQPIKLAKEQPNFVATPYVKELVTRALRYLKVGFPVHFSSPAGTGKTTLATFVAAQLGQPVILIHGDDEFTTTDLVGGEHGFHRKKTVDNFIQTVLKTEERVTGSWVDNRLTVACKHGFTLVYDEFTRSRPEANNVLLSVLEERILDLPAARGEEAYLRVHPNFRAIFTSNPQEYAGVYKVQDALKDRMVTIRLTHYDRDTEVAITAAKSGVSEAAAERIVDMVRGLRETMPDGATPTIRASIMIAKLLKSGGLEASRTDRQFVQGCLDIVGSELNGSRGRERTNAEAEDSKQLMALIDKFF